MSFGHLSLLALGVASPFEKGEGEGEGLLQAISTNGWASNPLTSILSPCLRGEAETDVMLIPEAFPTTGRCHHGAQPSLNIQ